MRVKLDCDDRLLLLFAEIPVLNDPLALLKFQVLTNDASIPHGKLAAWLRLHLGLVACPKFDCCLDGQRLVNILGRRWNDVVFFEVFQVKLSRRLKVLKRLTQKREDIKKGTKKLDYRLRQLRIQFIEPFLPRAIEEQSAGRRQGSNKSNQHVK